MYCTKCGKEIADGSKYCEFCGAPVADAMLTNTSTIQTNTPNHVIDSNVSPKSRLVALLLCWLLGCFGGHRFYVGKTGTAVAQLLTLGGVGVWALIDLIRIICGSFVDNDGKVISNWQA